MRLLIENIEDGQVDKDKNLGDDDDDKDKEYIELHALKIYLFDPMTQEFDL